MAGIPAFGEITKDQEDLFKKGYVYNNSNLASVSILSKSKPMLWKVRGTQRQNKDVPNQSSLLTTGWIQYAFKNGRIRGKMSNEQKYMLVGSLVYPQYVPGFKAKGQINVDHKSNDQSAKIGVEYKADRLKGKVNLESEGPVIAAQFTAGPHRCCGIGLDGAFSFASKRLIEYNAALWLNTGPSTLAFKYISKSKDAYHLGDFVTSYFRKINDMTQIGVTLTTNWANRQMLLEFGGLNKPFKDSEVRAKLNSQGTLGLSFSNKLRKEVKLTVASEFDTKRISTSGVTDFNLGFRVDFSN